MLQALHRQIILQEAKSMTLMLNEREEIEFNARDILRNNYHN